MSFFISYNINMIKKFLVNKICVTTLCLILLGLFYFLPTHESIKNEIINNEKHNSKIIYLLDEDNYVSKVITYFDSNSIKDEIKKRINILINGCIELNNFYPLIPKNTKLNSIKTDKNNVYLDFNNEIYNINDFLEDQMIESIVYSLTEINGIDNIYITVNNKEYNSNKYNYPLTRNIGINKKYNLDNFNNINKTTVFYEKTNNDIDYLVPVTNVMNSEEDKIKIIIKELKSSVNSQYNLKSYFNENIKLIDYSVDGKKMKLLFENSNNINDKLEVLLSNSIFENYNVDVIEISFSNGEKTKYIKK